MTGVQSARGQRYAHSPPHEYDADLEFRIKRFLKSSVALLGAEEATLRLYDGSGKAASALAYRRPDATVTRIGEVRLRPDWDGTGRSPQQMPAQTLSFGDESEADSALRSKPLVDSSGRLIGNLTARFAPSHELSEAEARAFEFSAEALEIVISSCGREEQARISADGLMERNADLESRNTSLAQSNQDLESFAMAASHDLKEPLRTVAMYAELLSRQHTVQMDGDAAYLVNGIRQSAESISALLADLMICAEVGANRDFDKLPAVDLNEVVEKAIRNLGISAGECGASITADRLPTIVAHEIHLLQLFQNLISNAIKYRGELPPKIHITSLSTPDQLEFVVSDNGIGIDPQYHVTVFEAFKRLGNDEISGTGMGLTICQRIVSRYGGRIWVESENAGGAAFHFTLPNAAVVPTNRTSALFAQPGGRPPVILLVDDNPADANLFRLALGEAGFDSQLTVIDDGAAALTYLRQVAEGISSGMPDVVVLDLHLPKCDGIQILEEMAASSALAAVPVLVWSSLLSPRDHQELRRFPFVIAKSKPAMLEEFLNIGLTVQELLRGGSGFSKASQS